jgi:hypothetical protein
MREQRHLHVSSTVMEPKVAVIWKVRPTPSRQIVRGAIPVISRPSSAHRARIGPELPVQHIEAGGLAGNPFGPISASISPA